MAFDVHTNLAVSNVATAPSPATSGTSLVVTAGAGTHFGTPPFNITIWPAGATTTFANAEIARCTAIATDTLTIVRAQEGTTARTVVVGDLVFTDMEAGLPYFNIVNYGATTGAADNATAIAAALTAAVAAGGGVVWFPAGTWLASSVVRPSNVFLGGIKGASILKQVASTSGDFVSSTSFSSQTLQGTQAGVQGGGMFGLIVDGNKANQSASNRGVVVFGTSYSMRDLEIRNCKGDGHYSEWISGLPTPATQNDASMEAFYSGVKFHDNTGVGWRHRGPHDSFADQILCYNNAGGGFLAESTRQKAIASGSNGVALPTATINANSTLGYPTAGTLAVTTSGGIQVVAYTGKTATTFTGCTGGTGTMSTGGVINFLNNGYASDGTLIANSHAWGNSQPWAWESDGATVRWTNCIGEGATGTQVILKGPDCAFDGEVYASPTASATQAGVQIGDSTNAIAGVQLDVHMLGFLGSTSANCGLNIVNDAGSGSFKVAAFQASGTLVFGTPAYESHAIIQSAGGTAALNAANSLNQLAGPFRVNAGLQGGALNITNGANDVVDLDTTSSSNGSFQLTHNTDLLVYQGDYSALACQVKGDGTLYAAFGKYQVDPSKGYVGVGTGPNTGIGHLLFLGAVGDVGLAVVRFSSSSTGDMMQFQDQTFAKDGHSWDAQGRPWANGTAPGIAAGAQSTSAAASGSATDTAGGITTTAKTTPAIGAIVTVTFAVTYGTTPKAIILSDRSTLDRGIYVSAKSATAFTVSTRVAPATAEVVLFDYHVIG